MIKIIKIVFYSAILCTIYACLGYYLEKHDIITKPAYFALYGYVWGITWSLVYDILIGEK